MNSINAQQIDMDIQCAERVFGPNNVFWNKKLEWIMIKGFALPCIFNQPQTNCLIIIPPGYGFGSKLEEFYINAGLKVRRKGRWVALPHYYQQNLHAGRSYADKNWHWLCIRPNWTKADNLMTFLKQIELFLKFPFDDNLVQ